MGSDGYMFVDRSGDMFALILQFMRTKQRPSQVILSKYSDMLIAECEYYGLDSMIEVIRGHTCSLYLRYCDRELRDNEAAAREDVSLYEKTMLLDVHATDSTFIGRESMELPLLLTDMPPPTIQGGLQDFIERLNNFSGMLLDDLRDIKGLVFAGGSVLGSLTLCPAGDIDIFLQVPVGEAENTLRQIFQAIQHNQARITKRRLMITRSKHAVTFYRVAAGTVTCPPIQVTP